MKDASLDRGLAMIDTWGAQHRLKGRAPVYGYVYKHPEPGEGADRFGAFHSSEIPMCLPRWRPHPSVISRWQIVNCPC
jgi:carboxylesterase type B